MTFPAWSTTSAEPGAKLSLDMIRKVKEAIFSQEPAPEMYVFPPVVHGTSQRDRARRTVVLRGGLPEGLSPHVYLFTDGKAFR